MLVVLSVVGVATACSSGAGNGKPTMPDVELARRWWEWAAREPEATNPITDATGEDCARNQPTDIWFLAASFGKDFARTCRISNGSTIFAPIFNISCLPDEDCDIGTVTVKASLDGSVLYPLRLTSVAPVTITGAANNAITGSADPVDVKLDGWWIWVQNITPGQHLLTLEAQVGEFRSAVAYDLTVE